MEKTFSFSDFLFLPQWKVLNLNNLSIFMKTYGDFREMNLVQVCGDHVLRILIIMVNLTTTVF